MGRRTTTEYAMYPRKEYIRTPADSTIELTMNFGAFPMEGLLEDQQRRDRRGEDPGEQA